MIKIAVVDDESYMLDLVQKIIKSIEGMVEEIDVETFLKPELFLDRIRQESKFDILFSDIEMPTIEGIEFAKIVKANLPDIVLIYLTAYERYAHKSYLVNAYQYILKEEMDMRIPEILKRCVMKIHNEKNQYRVIKANLSITKIYYKDIIYFKKVKSAKYVQFYTTLGEFKERTTLENVMLDLNSKEFVLVERGYVVNIEHIHRISGNIISMDNGDDVVISRARFSEVKEKIHAYFGGI